MMVSQSLVGAPLLGGCSKGSKDPKCWEWSYSHTQLPPPVRFEANVKSVYVETAAYWCEGNLSKFQCHQMALEHGLDLIGKTVLVEQRYEDSCHVIGGCGWKSVFLGLPIAVGITESDTQARDVP